MAGDVRKVSPVIAALAWNNTLAGTVTAPLIMGCQYRPCVVMAGDDNAMRRSVRSHVFVTGVDLPFAIAVPTGLTLPSPRVFLHPEKAHQLLQLLGLAAHFLGGGGEFLGG